MVIKITFSLYYLLISPSLLFPVTVTLGSSWVQGSVAPLPFPQISRGLPSTGLDVCHTGLDSDLAFTLDGCAIFFASTSAFSSVKWQLRVYYKHHVR